MVKKRKWKLLRPDTKEKKKLQEKKKRERERERKIPGVLE